MHNNHNTSNRVQCATISSSCDIAPPPIRIHLPSSSSRQQHVDAQQQQQQQLQQQQQQQLLLEQQQQQLERERRLQHQQLIQQQQREFDERPPLLIVVRQRPPIASSSTAAVQPQPPIFAIQQQQQPQPSVNNNNNNNHHHHHHRDASGHRQHRHHHHHHRHRRDRYAVVVNNNSNNNNANNANNNDADDDDDEAQPAPAPQPVPPVPTPRQRRAAQQPRRPPAPTPHFECLICDEHFETASAHQRHMRCRLHRDRAQRAIARQLERRHCLAECRVSVQRLTDAEVARACRRRSPAPPSAVAIGGRSNSASVEPPAAAADAACEEPANAAAAVQPPPKVRRLNTVPAVAAAQPPPPPPMRLPSAMRHRRPPMQLAVVPDSSSMAAHLRRVAAAAAAAAGAGDGAAAAGAAAAGPPPPTPPPPPPPAVVAAASPPPHLTPPPPVPPIRFRIGCGRLRSALAVAAVQSYPEPTEYRFHCPAAKCALGLADLYQLNWHWQRCVAQGPPPSAAARIAAATADDFRLLAEHRAQRRPVMRARAVTIGESSASDRVWMEARVAAKRGRRLRRWLQGRPWPTYSACAFWLAALANTVDERLQWVEMNRDRRHVWATSVRRRNAIGVLAGGAGETGDGMEVLCWCGGTRTLALNNMRKRVRECDSCVDWFASDIFAATTQLKPQRPPQPEPDQRPRQMLGGCSNCSKRLSDSFPCSFCPLFFGDVLTRRKHNQMMHPDESPSVLAFELPLPDDC